MTTKFLIAPLLLSMSLAALADPKPGTETRAWVDLQKNGKAASKETRPVSGEIADKSYERYVKSFDHPIPEVFNRESFTTSGGSDSSK